MRLLARARVGRPSRLAYRSSPTCLGGEGCKATGRAEQFTHDDVKHEARVVRACSLSGTAPHGADCDLKTVESGPYCGDKNCRKLLEKSDLDKEGRCLSCKKKPETAKICVRMDEGKIYRARAVVTCKACKAEGAGGGGCETKDCPRKGKPFELVCTDSGAWPHGGQALKK
jgi:hypothetical protein